MFPFPLITNYILFWTIQKIFYLNVARKFGKYAQSLCYQWLASVISRENLITKVLSRSLLIKACETGFHMIRHLSVF